MSTAIQSSSNEEYFSFSPSTTGVTSLMQACQQGQETAVRQLLHKDARIVNQRDRTGKTALHYCTENATLTCIEQVLSADPMLLSAKDEDGYTALHLATIAGNRAVVKYLIGKGADIHARDNEKHTAVHWAVVCGEVEILELLIDAGADPSTPDIHGAYPIHYAAQMCGPNSELGHEKHIGLQILQKLIQKGASVSVRDHDGRQPLLWAASAEVRLSHVYCLSGSADAILALINAGAEVTAADKDGLTALHCAASRGHLDCLDVLITLCSAEVDTLDANGCTPLFYAVTLGHADCTELLLKHGAYADRQDRKGRTPAHCGAAKGQLETLKLLNRRGADMWKKNIKGDLPLHEACQSGRKDLVIWLLSLQPNTINAANNDGRCPLHIAAINNNTELCKVLMDNKSEVNPIMRNSKGQLMTPVDAAVARGNRGCAKYLQLHGGLPASQITDEQALQAAMHRALLAGPAIDHTGATPSDMTGDRTDVSTPKTPSTLALTPSLLTPNMAVLQRNASDSGIQTDNTTSEHLESEIYTNNNVIQYLVLNEEKQKQTKNESIEEDRSDSRSSESDSRQTVIINDSKNTTLTNESSIESMQSLTKESSITENTLESNEKVQHEANKNKKKNENKQTKESIDEEKINKKLHKKSSQKSNEKDSLEIDSESSHKMSKKTKKIKKKTKDTDDDSSNNEEIEDEEIKNSSKKEDNELKKIKNEEQQSNSSYSSSSSSSGSESEEIEATSEIKEDEKATTKLRKKKRKEKSQNKLEEEEENEEEKEENEEEKEGNEEETEENEEEKEENEIRPEKSGDSGKEEEDENATKKKVASQMSSEIAEIITTDTVDHLKNTNEKMAKKDKSIGKSENTLRDESLNKNKVLILQSEKKGKNISKSKQQQMDRKEKLEKRLQDDSDSTNSVVKGTTKKVIMSKSKASKSEENVTKTTKQSNIKTKRNKSEDSKQIDSIKKKEVSKQEEKDIEDRRRKLKKTKGELAIKKVANKDQNVEEAETVTVNEENLVVPAREMGDGASEENEITNAKEKSEKNNSTLRTKKLKKHVKKSKLKNSASSSTVQSVSDADRSSSESDASSWPESDNEKTSKQSESLEDDEKNLRNRTSVIKPILSNDIRTHELLVTSREANVGIVQEAPGSSLNVTPIHAKITPKQDQKTELSDESSSSSRSSSDIEAESNTNKSKITKQTRRRKEFRRLKTRLVRTKGSKNASDDEAYTGRKNLARKGERDVKSEDESSITSKNSTNRRKEWNSSRSTYAVNKYSSSDSKTEEMKVLGRRVMSGGPRKVRTMDKNMKKSRDIHPPTNISITQAMQSTMRKYSLERRLFQQLLELKRIQIRNSRANEHVMIKRMVDEYNKENAMVGLQAYAGPYNFANYEKYLYDSLRILQSTQGNKIPHFKSNDDVTKLTRVLRKANVPDLDRPIEDLLSREKSVNRCNHLTHRCHHAIHAYTGVPCAAYLSQNRRNAKGGTTTGNLPTILGSNHKQTNEIRSYDPKKPLTVELQHGSAKQQISLPTNFLDKSKRYHLSVSLQSAKDKGKELPITEEGTEEATEEVSSVRSAPADPTSESSAPEIPTPNLVFRSAPVDGRPKLTDESK